MVLDIDSADIGYNQANLSKLIKEIKTQVIDEARQRLSKAANDLEKDLDPVWQGHSAKQFISNMHEDVNAINNALERGREALETELSQITNAMTQIDQELVK